jgi:hypothetical protein
VYAGGGNAGATIKNDFIELINHSGAPVSLAGMSVQYTSAANTSWTGLTPLPAFTLAPGQYFLIQEAPGAGGTVDLDPDATGTIPMGATAGKVALVSNTTVLTGGCPTGANIIDFVGYGGASCFEGSGPTAATSNTTAAFRKTNGCTDTDNNANDFVVGAPNPRNSHSATNNCAVLSATGSANPLGVQPGDSSTLTVNVHPGSDPISTGITVTADLTSVGGSATQAFAGNGTTFTFVATVAVGTTPGVKNLPVTITDEQTRTATTSIALAVQQPHVVISQSTAAAGTPVPRVQRFVEPYNPSGIPVRSHTGWSLQWPRPLPVIVGISRSNHWRTDGARSVLLDCPGHRQRRRQALALPAANIVGISNVVALPVRWRSSATSNRLKVFARLVIPDIVDFIGWYKRELCRDRQRAAQQYDFNPAQE